MSLFAGALSIETKTVNINALRLLLVEDNLADANWIGEILKEHNWQQSHVRHVQKVEEALDSLNHYNFDAILLDLSLPDSQGIASLDIVQQQAPQLPIVILTGTDDLNVAVQSLRQGAQDYLIKGEFEGRSLTRSIYYAIERQKIEFNTRQQALMKKMLDRIRNSIDLETILKTTVKEIQQFLHTEQVLVYRYQSDLLEAAESTAVISNSPNLKSERAVIDRFISALDVDSLDSIVEESTAIRTMEDSSAEDLSESKPPEFNPIQSYLILPIWLSESVNYVRDNLSLPLIYTVDPQQPKSGLWGMLIAYNTSKTRKWQDWELKFLQKLTTQVTVAIQQSQICCQLQSANQKLHALAILDGLTNIANRRYFDLVLDKEWQRLTREQKPLSLILCDVDHFKAYNDTYGHQEGDRCLQKIAKILKKSTRRPADLAARYGGEEFAVILPNTDAEGALFIAENIALLLAQKQLPHKTSSVSQYVTCSMGVSTIIPSIQESSKSIIETADRLLYQAKQSGRNQIANSQQKISSNSIDYAQK